jgi:hypothetical protein
MAQIAIDVPSDKKEFEQFYYTIFGAWLMAKTNEGTAKCVMKFFDNLMFALDELTPSEFGPEFFKELTDYTDTFQQQFNLKGFQADFKNVSEKYLDDLDS